MTDIIGRLKELRFSGRLNPSYTDSNLLLDAVSLIERQQRDIEGLKSDNKELQVDNDRMANLLVSIRDMIEE